MLAFWVIPKLFLKTFLLHRKTNWYFILKKAKSTERHMVREKSTNINVTVQKKKWEMANAITILRVINLNAFGMDTIAMIYYHCLLIILINALVIIKGNGWTNHGFHVRPYMHFLKCPKIEEFPFFMFVFLKTDSKCGLYSVGAG